MPVPAAACGARLRVVPDCVGRTGAWRTVVVWMSATLLTGQQADDGVRAEVQADGSGLLSSQERASAHAAPLLRDVFTAHQSIADEVHNYARNESVSKPATSLTLLTL